MMKLINRQSSDAETRMHDGSWRLPAGCDGAQQEADGVAHVVLRSALVALAQVLGDHERMAEMEHRALDHLGALARVDRLELAGLDAVAQDQLDHVAHLLG